MDTAAGAVVACRQREERTDRIMEVQTAERHARLLDVAEQWRREGDGEGADRLAQAAVRMARAHEPQVVLQVVFAGLFSAGKSSLLNRLTETALRAVGAVPTTAERAALDLPGSGGCVQLIDTPGVDSTDEMHRRITEAALQEADVVVLVMDYQHVEAEANLRLAQSWQREGRPLWLVINQIDKHLDLEGPFDAFRRRIQQTWTNWGIRPDAVFCVSAAGDHPVSELEQLREALLGLQDQAHELAPRAAAAEIREIIREHVARVIEDRRQTVEEAVWSALGWLPYDQAEAETLLAERTARLEEIEQRRMADRQALHEAQEAALAAWLRLIELAQISPHDTTELGRSYVESLRPDFKVGWWRSADRTAAERRRRLEAFAEALREKVRTNLVWPLQNQLREFVQETSWADAGWLADVDGVAVEVTEAALEAAVKSGALISDRYPYQYVKDVTAALKGELRGKLQTMAEQWFAAALAKAAEAAEADAELDVLRQECDALRAWLALDAAALAEEERWMQQCGV